MNAAANAKVRVTVDDFSAKYRSKGEVSNSSCILHDYSFRSMTS